MTDVDIEARAVRGLIKRIEQYELALRHYVAACYRCDGTGTCSAWCELCPHDNSCGDKREERAKAGTLRCPQIPCPDCIEARIALGMTTTNEVKPTKGE